MLLARALYGSAEETSSTAELSQPLHPTIAPLHSTLSASVLQPNKRVLTMSSDLDLDSVYTFAIQLGKDAGQLLQDAAQRRMSGEDQLEEVEKLNSVDIVTKTDEGKICPNIWKPIFYKPDITDHC
jgi:hypothetical protein